MSTPRVFLTDYASYNNGTQFQFGHWVNLEDFSDEVDFFNYVEQHFAKCDEIAPLDSGFTTREEIMLTDFEGFPREFYSESACHMEQLFEYLNLDEESKFKIDIMMDATGYSLDYCKEHIEDVQIYYMDKYELFELFYPNAYELENDYITIDEDRFIRDGFHEGTDEEGNHFYYSVL